MGKEETCRVSCLFHEKIKEKDVSMVLDKAACHLILIVNGKIYNKGIQGSKLDIIDDKI